MRRAGTGLGEETATRNRDQTGGGPVPGEVDVVVLGAGISGLVSAAVLASEGRSVLVVDTYPRVGGNHLDRSVGGYTFDVGSLVFQDDSPLLRHFPELLERYVPIDPSWGKLTPQGVVTDYPFSLRDDFLAAGPLEWVRILASAARARLRRRPLRSARDFARYWIGARMLHRSGLENYMERFCGVPAERVDLGFARKRMMWIAENASGRRVAGLALGSLRRALPGRRRGTAPGRANTQLARPREGFDHLYGPVRARLEAAGVRFVLGAAPERVARRGDGFVLGVGGTEVRAGRLVSTIPVDHARRLCGLGVAEPLPTVTLISLFFSFAGDRGFSPPILYNFSHRGGWKRLTVYSDFYGPHAGREFFAVEVIAGGVGGSVGEAERDFRDHVARNGLFAGDLRLEGSHVLDHAYPIYTAGAGDRAAAGIAELRALGVESFGRQGGFEYQPTARVSTLEAESALAIPRPRG